MKFFMLALSVFLFLAALPATAEHITPIDPICEHPTSPVQPVDLTKGFVRFCTPMSKTTGALPMEGQVDCTVSVGGTFTKTFLDVQHPGKAMKEFIGLGFYGNQQVEIACSDDDGVGVALSFAGRFLNPPSAPALLP